MPSGSPPAVVGSRLKYNDELGDDNDNERNGEDEHDSDGRSANYFNCKRRAAK